MPLRHARRTTLSALLSAVIAAPAVLATAPAASADPGVNAFSSTGVRSAGVSKMACTRYPSTRDINVTRKIYEIGQNRKISAKMMLAIFEAGWVESWLNNLNCGDRDSIGIFQMRPSMGWGTYAQLQDVTYQVNKWLDVATPLEARSSTAGSLAQAVERSGYPSRYDQSEATARKFINEAAQPYGAIATLWNQLGGATGSLGGPMTAETTYNNTSARYVQFSNGIAFTSTRGTFAIWGDNYRYWVSTGGYTKYGLPIMQPKRTATSPTGTTGVTQGFDRGWMYWSAKTKSHAVMPAMQPTFMRYGAEGSVGFPVADTVTSSSATSQTFEKAVLSVTPGGTMTKKAR